MKNKHEDIDRTTDIRNEEYADEQGMYLKNIPADKLTEKEYEQLQEITWKEIRAEEEKEIIRVYRANKVLINKLRGELPQPLFRALNVYLWELKEASYSPEFMEYFITDTPKGDFQQEGKLAVYVNQQSRGDTGDSWGGIAYISIGFKKYLQVSYSM